MHIYWHALYTQLALCEARGEALWCYWSAVAGLLVVGVGWPRCCWECVALQWGSLGEACYSVKPLWSRRVSSSGWIPLKSSPTCSCWWLRYGLQNVPRKHANCTAGMCVANRSWTSSWLRRLSRLFLRPLSGGEIPYVLLNEPPRRHLLRPFLHNRILALPRMCRYFSNGS
jgi:hypothetical protein